MPYLGVDRPVFRAVTAVLPPLRGTEASVGARTAGPKNVEDLLGQVSVAPVTVLGPIAGKAPAGRVFLMPSPLRELPSRRLVYGPYGPSFRRPVA